MRRRFLSEHDRRSRETKGAALAAACALALTGCSAASDGHMREPADTDAGIQLFQLPWLSIAAECEQNLAPAGFSWVLTSPPQEHIAGDPWWVTYQPVSYLVESRLGTREEFAEMVSRCADVGVDIIADAVINHMTGQDEPGTGWEGTPYEHYEYPGLYGHDDFHHCGLTTHDDIEDYRSREQVQTCELVNLADLDTASPHVRETIVSYLSDLLLLGVAGFRIDAAKHMAADDVAAIVAELPAGTRIMSEVIRGGGEPVLPEEYADFGEVFEFTYARDLAMPLRSGVWGSPATDAVNRPLHVPAESAIVFVDNHDTERGEAKITARQPELYAIANALLLADDYGTPVVYSGYAFTDRDAGAPVDADGRISQAVCADAPVEPEDGERTCIQTWPVITGMLDFRATVGDAPRLPGVEEGDAYGFEREGRGILAVNVGRSDETLVIPTSMPDGAYCDVIAGAGESGCLGATITVEGGSAAFTLPGRTAIAIHLHAPAP